MLQFILPVISVIVSLMLLLSLSVVMTVIVVLSIMHRARRRKAKVKSKEDPQQYHNNNKQGDACADEPTAAVPTAIISTPRATIRTYAGFVALNVNYSRSNELLKRVENELLISSVVSTCLTVELPFQSHSPHNASPHHWSSTRRYPPWHLQVSLTFSSMQSMQRGGHCQHSFFPQVRGCTCALRHMH